MRLTLSHFDLQSTSDFSFIRRSIHGGTISRKMDMRSRFSTVFEFFPNRNTDSRMLRNDLLLPITSVRFRIVRKIQNPVSARTCGFDPRHRHHLKIPKTLFYGGFRDFLFQLREPVICVFRYSGLSPSKSTSHTYSGKSPMIACSDAALES